MMPAVRIALMSIKLVMRTKAALFFTFLFPIVFLFVYSGIFARGNPETVLYFFGPVITLNIMGSSFWGLGMQSVVQRERGSLRRYRMAPIGPGTMVFSSLLANYLLQLPTLAILVFCATVFFHMPMKIGLLTLLALVTVGTFAFAGFGLTIASVANTMQEAQIFNNVAWITLVFLSGVTFPLPLLPRLVQRLAAFLPATYLVTAFQAIMVRGDSLLDHWLEVLLLLISGTFGLLFAWKLFRWEKDEKISRRAKSFALLFVLPFLAMGIWMNTRGNLATNWEETFTLMSHATLIAEQPAAAAESELLDDFKNPQEAEILLARWQISTDPGAAGHSLGEFQVISPGAAGTEHALRFTGRVAPAPGTDHGFVTGRYTFSIAPRAKGVRGIQFEVRGDNRIFQVSVGPSTPTSSRPTLSFVPDSDWQAVRLPAAWLANPEVASPAGTTWAFEITVDGPPGDFKLDLDEISLY